MADNAQKIPFGRSLQKFAARKIGDAVQLFGKSLPCTVVAVAGQIVTVNFDLNAEPFTFPNVTMPIATWIYDWIPVQVGDSGMTVACDVYLGGVSDLGGGVADLTEQANLSNLVFVPVASATWIPPKQLAPKQQQTPDGDPNMRVVQGPDGVVIQNFEGSVFVRVSDKAKTITVQVPTDGAVFLQGQDQSTLFELDAKNGAVTIKAPNGINLNGVTIADDGFVKIPQDLSVGTGGSAVTSYLNHTHPVTSAPGSTGAPTPGT